MFEQANKRVQMDAPVISGENNLVQTRESLKINRRNFLKGLALSTAVGSLLLACSDSSIQRKNLLGVSLDEQPRRHIKYTPAPKSRNEQSGILDKDYVKEVIKRLSENKPDPQAKINAVVNNLAISQGGSALMIDESGIYLSAVHVFSPDQVWRGDRPAKLRFPIPEIYHPSSGAISKVTSLMLSPVADLAIIFAPTGYPRKIVDNLQVETKVFEDRERLWLLSSKINSLNQQDDELSIISGLVSYQLTEEWNNSARQVLGSVGEGFYVIDGLIPFGGSSGCPIINKRGEVVGVESSLFPPRATKVEDYTGAVIGSTSKIAIFNNLTPSRYSI